MSGQDLNARAARRESIAREFERRFGGEPALWVRAPGRVDLMGSHTDYNLGYVMTMTLDRDTWLAVRPRHDRRVRVQSLDVPGSAVFSLDAVDHDNEAPWSNYVRGMAWALQDAGYRLTGFDGLIHSTIPFGSGLSSSAAIEMAAGVAFREVSGSTWTPCAWHPRAARRKPVCGRELRHPGPVQLGAGRGGQRAAARLPGSVHTPAPIAPDIAVVICDTRARGSLAGTEYGVRRAQCEEGAAILGAITRAWRRCGT